MYGRDVSTSLFLFVLETELNWIDKNLILGSPEPEIFVCFEFLGLEHVGDVLLYQRVIENLAFLYWRETKSNKQTNKQTKAKKGSKFPGDEAEQSDV